MSEHRIDTEAAEAIMADLHERLGLTSPSHITVLVVAQNVRDVLHFSTVYKEVLTVYPWAPQTLIYTREPLGGRQYWLSVQANITPANLHELPTAKLRAAARALLGLPATVEEVSTEAVEEEEEEKP